LIRSRFVPRSDFNGTPLRDALNACVLVADVGADGALCCGNGLEKWQPLFKQRLVY
jgi:hypothetical protein